MPEAVITFAGLMPYHGRSGVPDIHEFCPCLIVRVDGEQLFRVHVQLTWEGSVNATRALEGQGYSAEAARNALNDALLRYGMQRLEPLVKDWLSTSTKPQQAGDLWELTTEDVPRLLSLTQQKTCSYQVRTPPRDLYCIAASESDETAVGTVDGRRAAPTTRAFCRNCDLPHTDYICSHLTHPSVVGLKVMTGIVDRRVMSALCDQGNEQVEETRLCRLGGHECWQRIVEVEPPAAPAVSPLELAEAFDVLDAVWRLAFDKKKPLLSLGTVATSAALSLNCATRAEFETRLSDLADLIDRIKVDDAHLKPGTDKAKEIKGSLDALTNCLHHHLPPAHHATVDKAIKTLRTIRQARNAEQHGITEGGGLTAKLRDLGIYDAPPNWSGAWDVVRGRAVEALTNLRHELMAWVNTP